MSDRKWWIKSPGLTQAGYKAGPGHGPRALLSPREENDKNSLGTIDRALDYVSEYNFPVTNFLQYFYDPIISNSYLPVAKHNF